MITIINMVMITRTMKSITMARDRQAGMSRE
jgi:hypothetical protein